jgi:hypothetical protein
MRHFVVLSFAGMISDLYYGYMFKCQTLRQDFDKAKIQYTKDKEREQIQMVTTASDKADTCTDK